jgi:hypothetical protein
MTGMTRTKHIVKVIELRHGGRSYTHRGGLGNGWTNGNKNIFIEGTE